jgi:hypothetical protein
MHNNLLDISTWTEGEGSLTNFVMFGSSHENQRYINKDPWNKDVVIWEARPDADPSNGGGWNNSTGNEARTVPIDINKMYRFSVWMWRGFVSTQSVHFGAHAYNSSYTRQTMKRRDGSTLSDNSYFFSSSSPLPLDEWVLFVAHVWPHDDPGSNNHSDTGRWQMDGSLYGSITRDLQWVDNGTTRGSLRSLLYNTSGFDTDLRHRWVYPRIDLCDGTQPSLQSLIRNENFQIILKHSKNQVIKFKVKDVLKN